MAFTYLVGKLPVQVRKIMLYHFSITYLFKEILFQVRNPEQLYLLKSKSSFSASKKVVKMSLLRLRLLAEKAKP